MSTPIGTKVSDAAIRRELDRILQSPMFAQSERLSQFLRYTVEHVISGRNESLKEYVIGTEVYGRKPPYHPSQDSIVRTEARRLRSKLKEYYESEGKEDSIFIFFRPGSYVPVFRLKDSDTSYQVILEDAQNQIYSEGAGVPVAVIPFVDLSRQPLTGRFALGITEELIHELMQSDGCRVLSAHSTAYLGTQSDVPGLARKLGAQIVFEGTVREEGNRMRVTASIVSADGFQLWSQRLEAEADSSNLFSMQEQFASALVSRVKPQQSIVQSKKASATPLLLSVYPTILKGDSLLEEGTFTDVQGALAKFCEVKEITPGYARPFCGIARCHVWMALHGSPRSREHVSEASSAAEEAIKLDPQMTEALTSMGSVQASEWKWEDAEASFVKATAQRSHAGANRHFAMLLTVLGRFDEAYLYLERAQRIDPFSYLQKTARAQFFYLSGRYEEALEHFTEPLRYGPIPLDAQLYVALIYSELGKYEIARRIAEHAQRCVGADLPSLGRIAEIYARCEDHISAVSIIERFGLLSNDAGISKYRRARLAAALDRRDMAISMLSASYLDKEAELPYLVVEHRFDPIRQMPEFSELVRKIQSKDRS